MARVTFAFGAWLDLGIDLVSSSEQAHAIAVALYAVLSCVLEVTY